MPDVTRSVVLKIIVQAPTGVSGVGRGPVAPFGAGPGVAGVGGAGPIGGVSPSYGSMAPGIPTAYSGITPPPGGGHGGHGRFMGDAPYSPWSGRAAAMPGGQGRYRGDVPYSPYSGRAAAAPGAVGRMRGEGLPGSPWSGMPSRLPGLGNVGRIRGDIEAAAKATSNWAEALGRVSLEGARLATWSRAITRVTFGIESLGRGAVRAAGLGAVGIAGAGLLMGAGDILTGGTRISALRQRAGRAGLVDYFLSSPRLGIGPRERAVVNEVNIAAQQRQTAMQAQRERLSAANLNLFGLQSRQQLDLLGARSQLAMEGIIPIGGQIDAVAAAYRASVSRERALGRQSREFPKTPGPVPEKPVSRYGNLNLANPFTYLNPFNLIPQEAERPDVGPGAQQLAEYAQTIQDAMKDAAANSEKLADQWIGLMKQNLQLETRKGQQRLQDLQKASDESSKFLANIRASRLGSAVQLGAMSPAEVNRLTRQVQKFLPGGKLPRGEQITPDLQLLLSMLPPEMAAQVGRRYAAEPDIAALQAAIGFPREVRGAEEAAKRASEAEEQFQKNLDEAIKKLSDSIVAAVLEVDRNFNVRLKGEIEKAQGAQVRQKNAAVTVPGQGN